LDLRRRLVLFFLLAFYSGGGGGSNGSLMLVERNIFRNAETVYLFRQCQSNGEFGLAGFQLDHLNFSFNYGRRSFTEWNYIDGGYNTAGRFRSSSDEINH